MTDFLHFIVTHQNELYRQTYQHIWLTLVALAIALLIGIPLGILLTRYQKISGTTLGAVGVIQTIPSLALLGFLLPVFGIGAVPAIIALFLYALLPIVRNTYSGIDGVDNSVIEAAKGMGMSDLQILLHVELPLAAPVIFAGIRTATVINVGIATLCALIGSGGLGEFIFRGIALNNMTMLLAGAIPAALLALIFDFSLGLIQKHIRSIFKPLLVAATLLFFVILPFYYLNSNHKTTFLFGRTPEFTERADGYSGLLKTYHLQVPSVEMNSALLYQALKNKKVDAIIGYSTDGRILAYHLKILKDDKHYFPPYDCALLIRNATLQKYPQLKSILNKLQGKIDNSTMAKMNFLVDQKHEKPENVALNFLKKSGFKTDISRSGNPDITIGGKNFTEQFILAYMFKILIENYTNLTVGTHLGLAGTKICFDALTSGEIDMYPEYSGTGLYVLLKTDSATVRHLNNNPDSIYTYVKKDLKKQFNLTFLKPLGFSNTYAVMMRNTQAKTLHISTISGLSEYLSR